MSNEIDKKAEEIKELGANIKETLMGNDETDQEDFLKKAAVAGIAAIFVFWLIAKILKPSREETGKKKKKKKKDSMMFSLIKQQLGLIILAVIKKEVDKWLKGQNATDTKGSSV